jgi:hypothetical protein
MNNPSNNPFIDDQAGKGEGEDKEEDKEFHNDGDHGPDFDGFHDCFSIDNNYDFGFPVDRMLAADTTNAAEAMVAAAPEYWETNEGIHRPTTFAAGGELCRVPEVALSKDILCLRCKGGSTMNV